MAARATQSVCVILALLLTAGCDSKTKKVAECLKRGNDWDAKGEYDEAVAAFEEAIELDPQCAEAYIGRGYARQCKGQNDKAAADYTKAVQLDPTCVQALYNLGYGWFNQRQYDKALVAYDQAIRFDPKNADARAYFYRGSARDKTGEFGKAIADYNEAIRRDEEFLPPYFSLAQLYASCPNQKYRDGKKAVEKANRACELAGRNNSHILDALAAAYAEAGDFDKAVQWQTKAIELADKAENATERQKKILRHRLELYKSGKPFRRER